MATLNAFPSIVLIDRKAGQRANKTEILYQGDAASSRRPFLWERIVGRPWTRIAPLDAPRVISSPSGNPDRDGVFSETLRPGQVYQVVLYNVVSIDPNVVDPSRASPEQRPEASVTVVALLTEPEETNLIVSQDQNVGGTFFRKVVETRVPTFFMLQVSEKPPFKDGQGVERFQATLGAAIGVSSTRFDRRIEPLLPGNDLFYLMLLVDENGNWQTVSDQFRTLRRTVKVGFEQLHIINDGAQGDSTAEFRIWIMEGDSAVKDYFFGDVDNFPISDRPDSGQDFKENIPLALSCPAFTLGPKDVSDQTNDIAILTRGLVHRNAGSNEHSRNFFTLGDRFPDPKAIVPSHAIFPIPTGGEETIENVPFVVRTRPEGDVEFEYDVTARFTISYS